MFDILKTLKNISARVKNRFIGRKAPIDKPYQPSPHNKDATFNPCGSTAYQETVTEVDRIFGMEIALGCIKSVTIDENNTAHDSIESPNYLLGSGVLVKSIDPRKVGGETRPGIQGVCQLCKDSAIKAYEKGTITSIQERDLLSLYDTDSVAKCNICRSNICSRHSRSVDTHSGESQEICIGCLKKNKRRLLFFKTVSYLFAPFTETSEVVNETESA